MSLRASALNAAASVPLPVLLGNYADAVTMAELIEAKTILETHARYLRGCDFDKAARQSQRLRLLIEGPRRASA